MDDFCSPELAFNVYRILGTYKYILQARRFIHELFDGTIFTDEDFKFLDTFYKVKGEIPLHDLHKMYLSDTPIEPATKMKEEIPSNR
jgi:hypothetical protein